MVLLTVFAVGCSAETGPEPSGNIAESERSVIEEVRSVVDDLDQRQIQLDAQMRDPFSRP